MSIRTTLICILTLAVISAIAYFSMLRVDRALDMQAVHECALEYNLRYTDEKTNTVIQRPLDEPFRDCIWQKGVKKWTFK